MALARPKTIKIGKREWQLLEGFKQVPAGFKTNGASVPRIFWWFLDPATEAFEAAVLHDYDLTQDKSKFKMESHNAFYENLVSYNVAKYKALPAYLGVVMYHVIKGVM